MSIIKLEVSGVRLFSHGVGRFLDPHGWIPRRELIVELAEVKVA